MAPPAPDAADAWLNRLPLAERLAAAAATEARLWGWLLGWALVVGVSILILKTGLLGRLRRAIERDGPRPWLAGAALAGAFALALLAVKTPFDAANAWRGDVILHGAGAAGLGQHLALALAGVAPLLVAAMVLVPVLQWLIRKRPKTWPLIAGGLCIALCLGAEWAPYALLSGPPMSPLPAGPMREAISGLVAETHTPAAEIYRSTDPAADVDVTGGFGRASVSVGPQLADAPVAEARAMTGHLMGHYAHGDIFTIWLLFGLLAMAGLWAAQLAFDPLARLLGAGGLTGPADPEGLPVVALIAVAAIAASTLASSAYVRWVNVRADQYSLDHAREQDGLAAVLEREWDHQSVDPSPLAGAVFYTHPPLRSRLEHAMAWKAAHGG